MKQNKYRKNNSFDPCYRGKADQYDTVDPTVDSRKRLTASITTADETLTFSRRDLTHLVIAYESYRKLEQSLMLITGDTPDNPILAGLRHIDEIILDICPFFDDMDDDMEYETFVRVLDDPKIGAEKKAEILMGKSSFSRSSSVASQSLL